MGPYELEVGWRPQAVRRRRDVKSIATNLTTPVESVKDKITWTYLVGMRLRPGTIPRGAYHVVPTIRC